MRFDNLHEERFEPDRLYAGLRGQVVPALRVHPSIIRFPGAALRGGEETVA
jgi:hypothetical protein